MKFPKYVVPLSFVGASIGLYVIIRERLGGDRYIGTNKLSGKTVIITGATSGLGRASAEQLAKRGGRIILACRDMDQCSNVCSKMIESSFNTNIICKRLDLSSIKSINEFCQDIITNEKRLDILINNAGVMKQKREVTEDGFEKHIGINFLGPFLLTNLLVEKLKSSAPARIINIICPGYEDQMIDFSDFNLEKDYDHKQAYKLSKYFLASFTVSLASRLKDTKVTVNSVNPGVIESNIRREFGPHKSRISGNVLKPVWFTVFKSPSQGAESVLFAALDPTISEETGQIYKEGVNMPFDQRLYNDLNKERLWSTAEVWTKLNSKNL